VTAAGVSETVRETVTVNAPIDRAFIVFTENISTWWPAEHHIGDKPFAAIVIEPRAGGRFFERDADGVECMWGSVLAYDPPHRLVLGWHLQSDWKYDADPAKASEVEVRFTAEGTSATRVELEHSHFERHGDGGDEIRTSVGAANGWAGIMRSFESLASG
jgi:uncharacterized protein YndB with AHSA1/START domain